MQPTQPTSRAPSTDDPTSLEGGSDADGDLPADAGARDVQAGRHEDAAADEERAAPDEAPGELPPLEPPAPDREALGRALRELEAAKVRVARDARAVHDETRAQLVMALLPVIDNVDRTIATAEQAGDAPAVIDGVRLVRRQLDGVLERFGVERIDAVGGRFDPELHEAVTVVAVDDPRDDQAVVEQLEPGFVFGNRLLRPARVIVGRAPH